MDTEERTKAEAYAREQPNRARSLAVKAYIEEHAALLAEVERLRSSRPASAPAGTLVATLVEIRDHSSMQQGADGFYRSSVNVHSLAARALRVFGAPAGSAPEPSLVINALMVVSAEMHMAMGGLFDRKERDVRHAMQSLERAAALLEKRIALLRGAGRPERNL